MRRVLGATAIAVVALLGATTALPAAAAPAAAPADEIFYPAGQEPTPEPTADPKPADDNPSTVSSSRDDAELLLARGSRQAADLLGWLPSLYQGKWYMPGKEDVRKCIMDRESNFSYKAVGAGTYFGAYQMNAGLARGATYTMEKEVAKELGAEAVAIVKALRKTTPNNWNRYWQDRAFWTIWRNGDGAGHWRGGGLNCF